MVYVKNRTIDDIRNRYNDAASFHNDGVNNLLFLKETDAISFFKKKDNVPFISSLRINLYIKIHQLLNKIKTFLFLLKNSIKERCFKIKDALSVRDLTKVSFDYKNHTIRNTGIIRYKRDLQEEKLIYLGDEPVSFSEDERAISIVNKKTFFSEKIFQTSQILISDLSIKEKIYNKDYINLKTDQYERTTRIKEFLVFVIGGIIGALCVCFGWMATILLEAWQKNDIMYLFDKKNYISYMMTLLFIIAMIALLYIKNKYLDKTGIIADIDKIMGIKNDPSACWKFIESDKFKTRFLEFLKDITNDTLCQKIVLLKKNFGEIYNDHNNDVDLYNDKKIEIQNRILSVLKESDFSPDDKTILTLTTNQIHQIFEILIEYKNYTVVMSKNNDEEQYDIGEEQYDIGEFLRSLFSDLSKPHQNLNFDSSGKIVANGVG